MLIELLDSLDKYLIARQHLHAQLSRASLLVTRFKLGGSELNLDDLLQSGDADNDCDNGDYNCDTSGVRNRLEHDNHINNSNSHRRLLTKNDQIASLKAVYTQLLHTDIIPLALLKRHLDLV